MPSTPKPLPDLFVVGTDTGVGKSVVCLLLMQRLFAMRYRPFYLKPFQTGCRDAHDIDSDARFVYRHTAPLKNRDPSESAIYCHPNPKAPYFAACDAGQCIDPEVVRQTISRKRKEHAPLVIEAAGGLLVPVTRALLLIDMVQTIDCRPLLVARAGLGTINHTLLSIEALRRRGLEPLGVVLVEPSRQPAAADLVKENRQAIETFGQVVVGGVIGALENFAAPPQQAYRPLEKLLA